MAAKRAGRDIRLKNNIFKSHRIFRQYFDDGNAARMSKSRGISKDIFARFSIIGKSFPNYLK